MTIYQTPDFWTNASPHSDSSAPSCCGNSEVINSNDYSPALLGLSSPSMMSNAAGNIVDLAHPRQNHEGGLISSGYPSVHPGTGFLPPGPVPFPAHTASQSLFKPQMLETLGDFNYGNNLGPLSQVETCKVCGDSASGTHFGVLTCEGCKGFYKRNHKEGVKMFNLTCSRDKKCEITPNSRNNCRYCRYNKCIQAGMSRDAIKLGRRSKKDRVCLKKDFEKANRVRTGFLFHPGSLYNPKTIPPLDVAINGGRGYIPQTAPWQSTPTNSGGSMHVADNPNWNHQNYGNFFVPNLTAINYADVDKIKMEMECKVKNGGFSDGIPQSVAALTNPAPSFNPIGSAYHYARDPSRRGVLDAVGGYQHGPLANMETKGVETSNYRQQGFMTENNDGLNNVPSTPMENMLNECPGFESSSAPTGLARNTVAGNYMSGSIYSYPTPLSAYTSNNSINNNNNNNSSVSIQPAPFNEFMGNY